MGRVFSAFVGWDDKDRVLRDNDKYKVGCGVTDGVRIHIEFPFNNIFV